MPLRALVYSGAPCSRASARFTPLFVTAVPDQTHPADVRIRDRLSIRGGGRTGMTRRDTA